MTGWNWITLGVSNLLNGFLGRQKQGELSLLSQIHGLELSEKQHNQQLKIEALRQRVSQEINQQNAELQKWRFEQEKQLQKELASFNRETQLALAAYQRETTLSLPEANKIFENWPLRIVPSQILGSHIDEEIIPLRIFISPPDINFDRFGNLAQNAHVPRVESYLSQKLKDFLDHNYPSDDKLRPTEFLDGAFDSKRYHGGSSISILFQKLQSEPTLILESEIDGNYLNFRFAYWGLGESKPVYKTIFSRMPYRETVYESAKARALRWKPARDRLKEQGKNPQLINELDTYNLEILEIEEDLQRSGSDTKQLQHRYKVTSEDFEEFFQFLVIYHCLVVSWISDFYYLSQYDVPPRLPEILPDLISNIPNRETELEIVKIVVSSYQKIYEELGTERSHWAPDLMLQLAQSLVKMQDKSWAREQVQASIETWLELRKVSPLNTSKIARLFTGKFAQLLEAMKPVLVVEDCEYVEKLNQCLVEIGEKPLQVSPERLKPVTRLDIAPLAPPESLNKFSIDYSILEYHTHDDNAFNDIVNINISPDRQSLIFVSRDGQVGSFNLNLGKIRYGCPNILTSSIAFCPDGKTFASFLLGSKIGVYSLKTGQLIKTLSSGLSSPSSFADSIDFHEEKVREFYKGDEEISVINYIFDDIEARFKNLLCTPKEYRSDTDKITKCMDISPSKETLVSVISGNFRYDNYNNKKMTSVVYTWNLRDEKLNFFYIEEFFQAVNIIISPDCQTMITGGSDGSVRIRDLGTGELLFSIKLHSSSIKSMAICPDGEILVSSDGNNIKVYNLNKGKLQQTVEESVSSIIFSPEGKTLISFDGSIIKMWNINTVQDISTGQLLKIIDDTSFDYSVFYGETNFYGKNKYFDRSSIAISSDGQTLVNTCGRVLTVWRASL